jgi:3,4-dihydroxy 2-butanone 4-phosphate synthase / GTP cyclohydrolase II
MDNKKFSKISSIIQDAKKGKMFILVDDKNRENEGDLIIPASKCDSKSINFMAKHGRGLICLALTKKQIDNLRLPLMSPNNKSRMQTAFTISIEAKKGITTGISAQDRSKTIRTAINPKAKKNDIVSPGHVFPLVARNGGVLERAGHTEASVDISKLSNLNPSSVICEVMNEDGRMARLNDLYKFSKKHKIKLASIEDLISYRLKYERLIIKLISKTAYLNSSIKVNIHHYKSKLESNINFAITRGTLNQKKFIPVRVISANLNNKNILKNTKVRSSIKILSKFKNYLLLIINNRKNVIKDKNINTLRYYGIGAQIIKDLNVKNMILLSRRRKKIIGLDGFGLKIRKQIIIK